MAIYSNRIVISISKIKTMLKITNSQSTPTQAGLQVMWQVPVSTLQTCLIGLNNLTGVNSNLSNLRFVYNGQFVPAWLESINNGTATIWIKMPVSIPANSSITLNLYANASLNFDGVYWGEAPQLSSTYGQYDNGSNIFIYYQNFAGTSIPSGWTANSYTNAIINNGLKINSNTANQWAVFTYSPTFNPQTTVADFYAYATNSSSGVQFGWDNISPVFQYIIDSSTSYGLLNYNGTAYTKIAISGGLYSSYQVWSVGGTDSTGSWATLNYGNMVTNTSDYVASTSVNIGVNVLSNSVYGMIQWVRIRAYPPNGVMPTVELM